VKPKRGTHAPAAAAREKRVHFEDKARRCSRQTSVIQREPAVDGEYSMSVKVFCYTDWGAFEFRSRFSGRARLIEAKRAKSTVPMVSPGKTRLGESTDWTPRCIVIVAHIKARQMRATPRSACQGFGVGGCGGQGWACGEEFVDAGRALEA
jgi:hypothetical protein